MDIANIDSDFKSFAIGSDTIFKELEKKPELKEIFSTKAEVIVFLIFKKF